MLQLLRSLLLMETTQHRLRHLLPNGQRNFHQYSSRFILNNDGTNVALMEQFLDFSDYGISTNLKLFYPNFSSV